MRREPVTCLVMATMLEAAPFLRGLGLKRLRGSPFPVYRRGRLTAVLSGTGKANAAMAAGWACAALRPERLVNLGAAGALAAGLPAGTALQVTRALEPDRPGLWTGVPHAHRPARLRGLRGAVIATMDRPALKPAERRRLSRLAQLADMESASFIQACGRFGRECLVFKFVSDTPRHTSGADIVRNIKLHRRAFYEFFRSSVLPLLSDQYPHRMMRSAARLRRERRSLVPD